MASFSLCVDRWEIALPPMVDTAYRPEDTPGGGSGYVQFSLAWALDWDQRTRDRILVEKDAGPGGSDGLAATVAYAMAHNQPGWLTKVGQLPSPWPSPDLYSRLSSSSSSSLSSS